VSPKKPVVDERRALRVEAFFRTHLRHIKGRWAGKPFVLEPWQYQDIILPLFGTVGADGLRQYREALVELPRKNGKSEIGAGIALYMLIADGEYGAEVYSVAGSKQQAGIVFKTAIDMVRASPTLRAICKPYRTVIEVPEVGAIYRVLSADASLAHGYNPHAAIIDELHVHKSPDLYEAMRTGTAARQQPLISSITTAGEHQKGVAWDVHQRAVSGDDPRMFSYIRGIDSGVELVKNRKIVNPKALRDANPASWVTMDFLEDQARSLPPQVFARLHGNQWWTGETSAWITREQLAACTHLTADLDPDLPLVIAVDAASKRDTTAVMAVQRQDDGRFVRKCWHYAVDENMGYLDYAVVENLIRDLSATWDVRRVAFDPFQMVRTAQILQSEGIPVETFPQNDTRMVPASTLLYDLVMEEKLVLDACPTCTNQMMNAAISESQRGWRLHKLKSAGPIDSAVALAMACQLAEWEFSDSSAPRVILV
jgi:phage terminase large subunit-like protein